MQEQQLKPKVISSTTLSTPQLYAIEPVASSISTFPTTRYYGSKRKLLPWVFDSVRLLEFDTVLDAFGGTGSVSQLFRAMRKRVFYHDAFHFNTHVARTLLTEDATINVERLNAILDAVRPIKGTIAQNFENIFFLPSEDEWIDGFATLIGEMTISDADQSLLLYLLYQSCLKKRPFNLFHRPNLAIRTASGVNRSFGNATTWERSFREHMLQGLAELLTYRRDRLPPATVLPAGDVSLLEPGYDLVYLDPPYVAADERRNRDNYWRRYHFLEGLSKYPEWSNLIEPGSNIGMMPEPTHFTDWSRKKHFKEKLFDLIDRNKNSTVVLSYVKAAYPDDASIREFFESRFANVTVHSTEHSHALSGSKRRELLYIGVPK
ncbi:DNA adenine methylase [Rhizobium bangladeshense]|uniref:DNA adenine methylase n=1 Tax=Rhizobium bangladeshense TaxID=1138189 RepID=UPI001C83CCFB|nr:DNA adenine methylase [Rhizobium bangladeshense]MBX4894596.1 adenine methyltransferase [Rhizobium bangladeshense]MBY3612547.1 DNA adenine methylase [Rhizobium bangladeshense]